MPKRTPQTGDVYLDEKGRPCLFVRTELRQGTGPETEAEVDEPEHLFVLVPPGTRTVATRWVRAGQPLPEELELVVNAGAEARIAELEAQVADLEAQVAGLVEALKTAVGALPVAVANHVRRIYREARGQALTRGSK